MCFQYQIEFHTTRLNTISNFCPFKLSSQENRTWDVWHQKFSLHIVGPHTGYIYSHGNCILHLLTKISDTWICWYSLFLHLNEKETIGKERRKSCIIFRMLNLYAYVIWTTFKLTSCAKSYESNYICDTHETHLICNVICLVLAYRYR